MKFGKLRKIVKKRRAALEWFDSRLGLFDQQSAPPDLAYYLELELGRYGTHHRLRPGASVYDSPTLQPPD